jgi:hypothetical protein
MPSQLPRFNAALLYRDSATEGQRKPKVKLAPKTNTNQMSGVTKMRPITAGAHLALCNESNRARQTHQDRQEHLSTYKQTDDEAQRKPQQGSDALCLNHHAKQQAKNNTDNRIHNGAMLAGITTVMRVKLTAFGFMRAYFVNVLRVGEHSCMLARFLWIRVYDSTS